jgi:ATP-dependent 26S proteasome regulatory subunit
MSKQRFVAELKAAFGSGVPLVYVVTHEEARARSILAESAGGAEHIASWTSTKGLDGDASLRLPVLAILAPFPKGKRVRAFYDLHLQFGEPHVIRALRDFAMTAHATGAIVVIVSPVVSIPIEIERDTTVLDLPFPDATEAGAIFDEELAHFVRTRGFRREVFVRGALGLTGNEIARAFRLASEIDEPTVALARVVAEKRSALRRSSTLELISSEISLDDVGGLEVLKAWLNMRVLAFDDKARAFGLAEPRGMLVCGVQGCGKSLVSKAAARVLGLPLVRLDFADVFAMPSPEQALRDAMRVTEAISPVVLWVDEVEKGLGEGTSDAGQARVFGAFLTWLQERRSLVFVAATANDVERLPPELSRRGRFDEIFFVDLPSAKERQDILRLQLSRRGRDPSVYAVDALGEELEHFSGAELEQVVTGALFRAFAKQHELTDADLRAAARDTTPLAVLYEEKIQALRTWGRTRARRASADRRTLELFGD